MPPPHLLFFTIITTPKHKRRSHRRGLWCTERQSDATISKALSEEQFDHVSSRTAVKRARVLTSARVGRRDLLRCTAGFSKSVCTDFANEGRGLPRGPPFLPMPRCPDEPIAST